MMPEIPEMPETTEKPETTEIKEITDIAKKAADKAPAPFTNLVFIISGPSGAGKGTLCQELLRADKNLALSVSATTRAPRPGERYGREYYFYTQEEFDAARRAEGFLEWAEVHGRCYGTLKKEVEKILASGKDCLLEIDVQGGLRVRQALGRNCVTIFVDVPDNKELIRRIVRRNQENEEEIRSRMATADWERTRKGQYRYVVINNRLRDAVEETRKIIKKAREEYASAIN